jgi:hypothetical protein
MGAALGAVLARTPLLVKEWGDDEPRNRWDYAEAWFIGACMLISAAALVGALLS